MENHDNQEQKRTDFMAQVVGKYRLVGQVNYEEFLRVIGKLLHHLELFKNTVDLGYYS